MMPTALNASETIRFAALASKATLLRCVLRRAGPGLYELTRTAWNMSRTCTSLDEVAGVLRLMGAEWRETRRQP